METGIENITLTPKPEPKKIGGLLILVALGLLLNPLRMCMSLVVTFPPMLIDGTWGAMTTPGSEFYSPLWSPLLMGELTFNLVILLVWPTCSSPKKRTFLNGMLDWRSFLLYSSWWILIW
jgi:hypothetical protein